MRTPTPTGAGRWLSAFKKFRSRKYNPHNEDNLKRAIQWAQDDDERNDLLQALARLEKRKRKPQGGGSRTQLSNELLDGFAGFYQTAPRRPYCTNDPRYGQHIRPLHTAVKMSHMQPNPPGMVHWLVFDIDHSDAVDAWQRAGLLQPQLVMRNTENGHAHAAWRLSSPVCSTDIGRAKPMRYARAVQRAMLKALDADSGYSGGLLKTPGHKAWETIVAADIVPYSLSDLAQSLDLRATANRTASEDIDTAGLGRNCTMFEIGRKWAYTAISGYWGPAGYDVWRQAVTARLSDINAQFPVPLLDSEVRATAKSIARWTWRNITPASRANLIARTHTSEQQAERGRRAQNQAAAGRASAKIRRAVTAGLRALAHQLVLQGLSTREIAHELDVNQSTVVRWLR
ncbi:MAG: replication initiation protein [Acidihalobacter sp.]|uniref:replication initiation protein n=1 Tax=Acidihalobacter sp. TaxID=1872108 RepID=UPI00307EE5F8